MNYKFNFVDGPVGSHKTTSLLSYLRTNPVPATIGTQTNDLSGQYGAADGLNVEMICRKELDNGDYTAASKTYRDSLKSKPDSIYAVNQSVAIGCQDADPDRLYFFDEIPNVFETFKFNSLPYSQEFVAGWFGSKLSDEPSYYELVATDFIQNIAESGWKDDLLKDCSEILTVAQRIASNDYRVFVNVKQFNAFKNRVPKQIQFFVVARPSLFPKHSTFLGANFKRSLQYLIWSASEDVDFVPHPQIKAKHEDLRHKAEQTNILFVAERNFSKSLFDEKKVSTLKPVKATSFPKVAKSLGKVIHERFPDQPFIWCSNTIYERTKWARPNGERVSSNSRGWNGGRHYNMAVFLAAINFDPASVKFLLKVYGIDREAAKYALTYESAYQFAGRTSLRMADSDAPVTLIFGDRATAKAMQSFIPGCKEPELLDIGIPELLFPDEPEEDDAKEVKPIKTEKVIDEVREQNNEYSQLRNRRKLIKKNHAETYQYDDFKFRFWAHREALETIEAVPLKWQDVLEFFHTFVMSEEIEAKEANKLYREGALFDLDNHLLKDNIRSTKIVILDIDDVRGDVNELSAYLRREKISNLIVSTYSCLNVANYTERDIRVRVLIPLTEAVDADNYKRIIRLLNRDIREKFPDGEHGSQFPVDPSCMSINNRFYAPGRPARGEPIFIDGTYYSYDVERFVKQKPAFLDAQWYMLRNLPEDIAPLVVKRHTKSGVSKAADDIVLECAAKASAGNGDPTFYNAAVELVKAGYSKEEAIAALTGKEKLFGSGEGRSAERAVTHAIASRRAA